ncbi:hypothetical protein [Jannaschia pohangensis]|uniref:Uncharacterized protein n=1 Tax=Jannaschia pohangensis TaxID=390807 RepID=A0A1I3TKS4_9RHOB|nr:hypothetical protein [Jannaschia pohangensis]SFJ70117.1 hypothetical protein SAMN04488095_3437 [Jannaschia pohangensis]
MSANKTHTPKSGSKHAAGDSIGGSGSPADIAADKVTKLRDKAAQQASHLADEARHAADEKVEDLKGQATSRIEETAENIRNAGHEFGHDSYQAQAADYLASNLTQAAEMIRDKDLGSVVEDLSTFARRNPALFLGGAALLGFAAARMMKASERQMTHPVITSDYKRPADPSMLVTR